MTTNYHLLLSLFFLRQTYLLSHHLLVFHFILFFSTSIMMDECFQDTELFLSLLVFDLVHDPSILHTDFLAFRFS